MRPIKRSFTIAGHSTSISLEEPFWQGLKDAAGVRNMPLVTLVQSIDQQRGNAGLSSAVRVWLLEYYRGRTDTNIATTSPHVPDRSPRPN
jgi:predicted DNA-binding ribbon-helix-helix protein